MGNNMNKKELMKKIIKYIESLTTYKIIIMLDDEIYRANEDDALTISNRILKEIQSQ
tara:strand:+ start:566 stop:736 length:171 start_codon:yes stop_codon:yes gene_type:complete